MVDFRGNGKYSKKSVKSMGYFSLKNTSKNVLSELNFFWLNYAYGIYQLMLNERRVMLPKKLIAL